MDLWAYTNKVQMDFNRRGKPTDNATVESFNGKFREECLNAHWFESIADAKYDKDTRRETSMFTAEQIVAMSPEDLEDYFRNVALDVQPGKNTAVIWFLLASNAPPRR